MHCLPYGPEERRVEKKSRSRAAHCGAITPPITSDQVVLLKSDNVVSGAYPGLTDLGIAPTTLEAVLPAYLYRYRKGGQYADQEDREMAGVTVV